MATSLPPSKWTRHRIERRVRPTRSSTTSRTASSVRSAHDTALHIDNEACEPSQRRQWRRLSQARTSPTLWHQSRAFFAAVLFVLIICLAWTSWLLLLTLAPNQVINYVMRTKNLDNGSFWMLVEPTPSLQALSLAGLVFVALGYLYVGFMVLVWGRQRLSAAKCGPSLRELRRISSSDVRQPRGVYRRRSVSSLASIHPDLPTSGEEDAKMPRLSLFNLRGIVAYVCLEMSHKESHARKIAHVWVKVIDLMLQMLMLYQTLEAGFPLPLVGACTCLIVWNALAVVALMHSPLPPSHIGEAVVDSISDFLVAIGFPVLVLAYCLHTFEYDRSTQLLAAEIFSPWSFANAARAQANPEQTAKVFKSIEGLRFRSVEVCIARIGNNLALLVSLRRLIKLLRGHLPVDTQVTLRKSSIYPRKHPLALLLVGIAVATVVSVLASVHRSHEACREYPTCTIHAYRWRLSSRNSRWDCPCRVVIDADLAPTNYSAWSDPPDATADVSSLAASGDLEILQVINRRLPELPDTLRRCLHLKHIALIFTHTSTLPPWAADFAELEYLHIEGKSRALSLVSLPQNLFKKMKKLTFVHLGAHEMLPDLPDVGGLTNLRSITMAGLQAVRNLPADFAQLTRIEILLALMLSKLQTFPDISRTRHTLKALVVDACPLCCDGFLRNECDLSSATCEEDPSSDPLACLPVGLSATSGTLELFETFNATICTRPPMPPPFAPDDNHNSPPGPPMDADFDASLVRGMQQCDGILYRQCKPERGPPGATEAGPGICSSDRFMPISCVGDPSTIEFRRQQIKRRIGRACDPRYEAWLGCSTSLEQVT